MNLLRSDCSRFIKLRKNSRDLGRVNHRVDTMRTADPSEVTLLLSFPTLGESPQSDRDGTDAGLRAKQGI